MVYERGYREGYKSYKKGKATQSITTTFSLDAYNVGLSNGFKAASRGNSTNMAMTNPTPSPQHERTGRSDPNRIRRAGSLDSEGDRDDAGKMTEAERTLGQPGYSVQVVPN